MTVWRLVAHDEDVEEQLRWSLRTGRLAIGWGAIGDLRSYAPKSISEITKRISDAYPRATNAHLGGPSLWDFFQACPRGTW
jgi:hypothetical protein